jgi:hypothetical protein
MGRVSYRCPQCLEIDGFDFMFSHVMYCLFVSHRWISRDSERFAPRNTHTPAKPGSPSAAVPAASTSTTATTAHDGQSEVQACRVVDLITGYTLHDLNVPFRG